MNVGTGFGSCIILDGSVGHYHLVACSDKLDSHMAADIAGTAGNQNSLCHCFLLLIPDDRPADFSAQCSNKAKQSE